MIVHPEINRPFAVILFGPQGSGKSMFGELVGEFFGPNYLYVDSSERLMSKFNSALENKLMVFVDEGTPGTEKDAARLKTLVSSPRIEIERKGWDTYSTKKSFRLFMATNSRHAIRADADDRRYLVLRVDAGRHNNDYSYFHAIREEWRKGGREALFNHLRHSEDWDDWTAEDRPVTTHLQDMKDLTLDTPHRVVQELLDAGVPPAQSAYRASSGTVFVATDGLLDHARVDKTSNRKVVGELLQKALGGDSKRAYVPDGRGGNTQQRGVWLGALSECRERWENYLGRDVDWSNEDADWQSANEPSGEERVPF
jgi:hypothetical protein